MIIEHSGNDQLPALLLIHEGGLGAWMWRPAIELLKKSYRVLSVVLDGHGAEAKHDFVSIVQCAEQLEGFIQNQLSGQQIFLAGYGLGGQIACELLGRMPNVIQAAVIEDAPVIPDPKARQKERFGKLQWKLSQRRRAAGRKARALGLNEEMQADYLRDAQLMSQVSYRRMLHERLYYALPVAFKQTNTRILALHSGEEESSLGFSARLMAQVSYRRMLHERLYYALPVAFKQTNTRILALHSGEEESSLGFSARLMARNAPHCRIQALQGTALCIRESETYAALIQHFFKEENP